MMAWRWVGLAALGLVQAPAWAGCAATIEGLQRLAGEPAMGLRWTETGMDDGKPLVLALSERGGLLHLRFEKSGEGLWAEGSSVICGEAGKLVARFEPSSIRPGPAAPWLLRQSLARGARFELERPSPGLLQVSTPGWRSRFAAAAGANAASAPAEIGRPGLPTPPDVTKLSPTS